MKPNLNEILYRVKNDRRKQKALKKILMLGCLGVIVVVILLVTAGSFLFSYLFSFITENFPAVTEMLFGYARGFMSGFVMEDLLGSLSPLADTANVTELKGMITQYFDQLKNNPNLDYQSFQNFISTIRNIISDGQVMPAELEKLRRLIPGNNGISF